MDLNFSEGTIPTSTVNRTTADNPFTGKFPTPEGRSLVVTLPSKTDEDRKNVDKVVNLAQKAARDAAPTDAYPEGMTARVKRDSAKNGAETVLTMWTVKAIKRARLTDEEKATREAARVAAGNKTAPTA